MDFSFTAPPDMVRARPALCLCICEAAAAPLRQVACGRNPRAVTPYFKKNCSPWDTESKLLAGINQQDAPHSHFPFQAHLVLDNTLG